MKKGLFILRQLLIFLVMVQLLNLSICSESYWEYYNYASHENSYDPTETMVEWVVEKCRGNQDAFSYNNSINLKGLSKNFAWHVDLCHQFPIAPPAAAGHSFLHAQAIFDKPSPACIDILSPPPEPGGLA